MNGYQHFDISCTCLIADMQVKERKNAEAERRRARAAAEAEEAEWELRYHAMGPSKPHLAEVSSLVCN